MIVVLYHNKSACPFRASGQQLARDARLGLVSLEALSKARGVSSLFKARR